MRIIPDSILRGNISTETNKQTSVFIILLKLDDSKPQIAAVQLHILSRFIAYPHLNKPCTSEKTTAKKTTAAQQHVMSAGRCRKQWTMDNRT